ncbi:nitrite reductase [Paenibacillus albiflavus]|uniref:Nitrite reductase n=1 Tax=Paenibacillus albiflavus TaxID=2545760 RepID=A0A4R4ED09_9BACL|nr:ATP:cob(I)alamin adenosyltransferase [Paenibacillus albiflavus]TCZ77844.1 nitrite reductase [Paenibacillus albiflavus]
MTMGKFAVTPGFEVGGAMFRPEQLAVLGSIIGEDAKIELTTFKQLYVEMAEDRIDEVQTELKKIGLEIYPSGFYTKSLIACHFCRGAEDAGLEIARKLNEAIAGLATPGPLKIGYAGCALGTSEPLLKDIGVVKIKDKFSIYIGGEPKSIKAGIGSLFLSEVPEEMLIPQVLKLIHLYQKYGKMKEKFARFIDRMTVEELRARVS